MDNIRKLIQKDKQRRLINSAIYEAYVLLKMREAEEAARRRQELEELNKRAVDDMAKQDLENTAEQNGSKKTNAGAEEEIPQLLASSYLQDSTAVDSSSVQEPQARKDNGFRFFAPQYAKPKLIYPTSIFDLPSPKLTTDPNTGRVNWGLTAAEQDYLQSTISLTPLALRSREDADYYNQLKIAYLDNEKDDSILLNNKKDDYYDPNSISDASYKVPKDIDWNLGKSRANTAFAAWLDNTIANWALRKNESEIGGYKGRIDLNTELRKYAQDIINYGDALESMLYQQEEYNREPAQSKLDAMSDLYSNILALKEDARIAATYLDKEIPLERVNMPSTVGSYSVFAKNNKISDLVKTLDANRQSKKDLHETFMQLHLLLEKQTAKWDKEDDESREGMRKNMAELEKWKAWRKIDPEFLARSQAAMQHMKFSDPDTYLYGLSGVMGSSAAFNGIQWANMFLSAVGSKLTFAGPMGAVVGVPLTLAGTAVGMKSGELENNMEISTGVNEKFKQDLQSKGELKNFINDANKKLKKDLDFEGIMNAMALGEFEPLEKHKKEYVNSTLGAHNQFMNDMMAVTGSNLLETTINFVPFGKFAEWSMLKPLAGEGTKISKLRRLAKFKENHPNLYKFEKSVGLKALNLSEGWYNFGAALNPVFGVALAPMGYVTKPITKALSKKLDDVASWTFSSPKTLLNVKAAGNTAADFFKRVTGTMWAEGLEEGKQHYHAKEFAAGNYAGESDSLWDLVLGDIEGASKSATQFFGSYLGMTSDEDWVGEIRGGMLAGGGHTAVVTGYADVSSGIKLINANNLVVNNILATKLQERSDIEKGRSYASKLSFADRKAMNEAFDKAIEVQELITERGKKLGDPEMVGIPKETIEEQRKMYNNIFNLANSDKMRNAAEIRGITPGSDKYATFVSLTYFAQQELNKALKGQIEKSQEISNTINLTLWGEKGYEGLTDQEVFDIVLSLGLPYDKKVHPIYNQEAIEEDRKNRRAALPKVNKTVDYIAHLDALLSQRDQLELKDNKTSADKRKLRSILKQIEILRNSVKTKVPVVDKDGNIVLNKNGQPQYQLLPNEFSMINDAVTLQKYVYDIDLHEVIRDQYRDFNNYGIDFDNALAMQYALIGEENVEVPLATNEQLNEIIYQVNNDLKEQYRKAIAVTDNKNVKIEEGKPRVDLSVNKKAAKKAQEVIDQYLNSVKSDEEFEQRIHDDMERAIREMYEEPEEKKESPVIEPKVEDSPVEEVIVKPEEEVKEPEKEPEPKSGEELKEEPKTQPIWENKIEFGNLYDYVDAFPLVEIPEQFLSILSDSTREEIKSILDDFNNWIKNVDQTRDENGRVTSDQHLQLMSEYYDLINRAEDANEKIDAQIKLDAIKEDQHVQDEIDRLDQQSDLQQEAIDFFATMDAKFAKLQAFLQSLSSSEDFKILPETIEDLKLTISDLDEMFTKLDVVSGEFLISRKAYEWYWGIGSIEEYEEVQRIQEEDGDKSIRTEGLIIGARERVLNAINGLNTSLPDPIIPDLPIAGSDEDYVDVDEEEEQEEETQVALKATFDTSVINDPSSWKFLSFSRWLNPKYNTGIVNSVSTTDKSVKLIDVLNDPNFVNNAQFELILIGNNQPFVVVHYKGHEFTPVFLQTAEGVTIDGVDFHKTKGFPFWNRIVYSNKHKSNGQRVVAVKVKRNPGIVNRYDQNGNLVEPKLLQDVGLLTDTNMYELEFSSNQLIFGITNTYTRPDGVSVIAVYDYDGNVIYEYKNSPTNNVQHGDTPSAGVPVMLIDRKFSEYNGKKVNVPLNLLFTKLTEGDADLIIEILRGEHCADRNSHGPNILSQEYIQDDGKGNIVEYGITNGEVLNLLLRYGYRYPQDRRHIHVEYNPDDNRKVSLVGFIEGEYKFDPNKPDEIPSKEFNLFDENEKQAFKEAVVDKINRNFSKNIASARVGERFAQDSNPFKKLNQKRLNSLALTQMLSEKGKIKFGNSAIEFDIKDFIDDSNKNDSDGVSGIVWYARHGFLKARFNGFTLTILIFDEDAGVAIVDKDNSAKTSSTTTIAEENEKVVENAQQQIQNQETPVVPEDEQKPLNSKKNINIVDEEELAKREETLPTDKERINIEEAKRNILRMLGKHEASLLQPKNTDNTVKQMLAMFKNGPVALGTCEKEFITLSKFARRGTEYHEAFHRVCEFLLSDSKRKHVYEAYAKAKHIKLYDSNGKIIVENQKIVTEGLADEFMLWATDRPTIKLTWNIKELYDSFKSWINFYKKIGSVNLYLLYRLINSGYYANLQPSKEDKNRVQKLLDEYGQEAFNFTINGKPFKYILNGRQYRNLCDTMLYILFLSLTNIDKTGRNILDFKMDDPDVIREYKLFKKYSKINPALSEMLDYWDVVKKDIRTMVEQIATPYTGSNDNEDNVEDAQGDTASVSESGIGDHIRQSSEFSQFSRAGEKVKHFFARIPAIKFADTEDGKRVIVSINNAEGLPHFVKASTMYNTVLNQVYNCRSLSELMRRIQKIGEQNALFERIYKYLSVIKDGADKGNVEDATFLTQLCVNLHAAKNEYITCKANRTKNGFDLIIMPTGDEYSARNYRREWSSSFANGSSIYIEQNANGDYVMKKPFDSTVFNYVAKFFYDFSRAVSEIGIQEIDDPKKNGFNIKVVKDNQVQQKRLDVRNNSDLSLAKSKFISTLNSLGIMFNLDMLDYALNTKYGSSGYEALNKFFIDNNFYTFVLFINGFNNNGKLNIEKTNNGYFINTIDIQSVFNSRFTKFVGELAKWAYNYKKSNDLLSVFANNRKKMYLISENNYITDTIDELNASVDGDKQKVKDLESFIYNWMKQDNGAAYGSIILKNFESRAPQKLRFITDIGFKTDAKDDAGEDYSLISQVQDEVTKIELLLSGKIIFPTMESKKTWGYIDGITLPGLNLENLSGINTIKFNEKGSYEFSQNPQILQQLREYAILEHQAVLQTYADVTGEDLMTGEKRKKISDKDKIKNYHKSTVKVNINGEEKSFNIIQGARYSTLYAIYDSKGRKISFNRVCDENGNFISERQNIEKAMDYFFGVPSLENPGMYWVYDTDGKHVEVNSDDLIKIQNKLLSRSLQLQLRKQMLKAEYLGLIERVSNDEKIPFVLRFRNKLLSTSTLNSVKRAITQNLNDQQKESLAIAIIMNDVSCKSIMSLLEVERIFSGHPAFYKWVYNSKGILSDRSTDQHKRLGGLVSTGQNNAFVFKDLPTKYVVAELDDEEIQSKYADQMLQNIYEGEIRSAYHRKMLKDAGLTMQDSLSEEAIKIAKDSDELSLDVIEKSLDDLSLLIIRKRAIAKSNAFRKDKSKGLSGINVADGATYITDDMCENMLKLVGSYGEEIQRAFKVLRGEKVDGKKYTTKDIRELVDAYNLVTTSVIGTQKYTAYGFRKQNGILVPYYNKTAIFPLFKSLCTGNMARLYEKMKKDGVDMVMMNSAVKVGSQGSKSIDWNNFEDGFTFNTYEQEYKYLRKLFNTDPKEKELMQMGSQMTKIVMAAMLAGKQYVVTNPDGSKQTINAINVLDGIMDSINNLSDIGYKKLRNRLFDGNRLNVLKFSEFLIEELSSRGASRNLLDAVSIVDENSTDIDDERRERLRLTHSKELKTPLTALSGMDWIQSIINSKVNKSVIDINTPGAAFIQRSVFGMEGETTMISSDNLPPSLYEGRDLKVRNENGSMDCVLSIDFFKHIIPEGLSFAEARQWLIDNKIISGRLSNGEWSDADASIVGYRIPTQAPSSIHALRCVDVIETVPDTIILPKEFPAITGADFDIDKLFLSTFYYNTENNSATKVFKEGTEQYFANKLISYYIALLKDSKSENNAETRTMNIGDGPIDSDTKLLTNVVEDLESATKDLEVDVYDPYSLWRNTYVRDLFIIGKFGIGPFALNNNNHILTMLYSIRFKHNDASILGILDKESLHDAEDMYGESIMSWLSGLINGHVDIAKDPFVSKLNINSYTYNLINLLVRTGFGKTSFYFATQPILKRLSILVNNAASSYGSNPNKSKFRRQLEAEQNFIVDFANRHLEKDKKPYENVDNVLSDFIEKLKRLGTSKTSLYRSIFDNKSTVLQELSKSGLPYDSDKEFAISTENGTVSLKMYDLQMLMYLAKTEFDPYAKALADLVKYCKIDTKKQGKTITEQRDFMRGYNRLFMNPGSRLYKMFDEQSLKNLRDLSYIDKKTQNATSLFRDILLDQLIEATETFNRLCEGILMFLPVEDDNVSQSILKKISDSILISIRSEFFNSYALKYNIDIKGLVSGKNTIYDRLIKLKIDIKTKNEYSDLRNADGSIDNYLINTLVSGFIHKQTLIEDEKNGVVARPYADTYNNAKFLSTMTFMDDDSIDVDEMTNAWEELLEDNTHPELQKFARDLIVYSFITNGGVGGSNNIYKYIPTSWIVNPDNTGYDSSFASFMAKKLEVYLKGDALYSQMVDDVILNNWTDNMFIPTIRLSKDIESFYTGKSYIDLVNGQQVAPQTDIPIMLRCNPFIANSRFIKINRNHDKQSQRSVAIYKKVKYGVKKVTINDTSVEQPYNVYVLVNPKGQNFGGKNKIYEYGREDAKINEINKQLGLNEDLMNLASYLGANTNSIESVLEKLSSFLESKTDKEGTLAIFKSQGVEGILYDTLYQDAFEQVVDELTDEDIKELENDENGVSETLQQSKLSGYWNNSNEFSDEEMNHCKH